MVWNEEKEKIFNNKLSSIMYNITTDKDGVIVNPVNYDIINKLRENLILYGVCYLSISFDGEEINILSKNPNNITVIFKLGKLHKYIYSNEDINIEFSQGMIKLDNGLEIKTGICGFSIVEITMEDIKNKIGDEINEKRRI